MVEGAALEMLCTEMYLGFESLTLRQREEQVPTRELFFFLAENLFKESVVSDGSLSPNRFDLLHDKRRKFY